jgi:hypothetical protein
MCSQIFAISVVSLILDNMPVFYIDGIRKPEKSGGQKLGEERLWSTAKKSQLRLDNEMKQL